MRRLLIGFVPFLAAALVFTARMPDNGAFDRVSEIFSPSIAAAQDAPAKPKVDMDINVNPSGRAWFNDPTVLLIGGGALVLLVALIALASRGGGTTIVEK